MQAKDMSVAISTLSEPDLADLQKAHEILENPSIAARFSNLVGSPIEQGIKILPESWNQRIHQATTLSIEKALDTAIQSLPKNQNRVLPHKLYTGTAIGVGALSGLAGLPALLIELPVSTTLLLRAIADIARQEGEQLDDIESRLACMEVFALGGIPKEDDAAETGYYGLRIALATTLSQAAQYITVHGVAQKGAPALVSIISAISTRFGASISQKAALQFLPLVGAIGGASINGLFMGHFKSIAHGHFTLRRLERKYGKNNIYDEYQRLTY